MLLVTWEAPGVFTGSGIIFLFSVDIFAFFGSFRVKSNTTIEIYVSHDVSCGNEVHHFFEKKTVFLKLSPQYPNMEGFSTSLVQGKT